MHAIVLVVAVLFRGALLEMLYLMHDYSVPSICEHQLLPRRRVFAGCTGGEGPTIRPTPGSSTGCRAITVAYW